jgi:histidinol-phosphate aminotransferase
MIKRVDNRKIKIDNIYRSSTFSNRRLDYIRLDKNERADPHLSFFFNKLKDNITSDLISAYPEFHNVYKKLSKKLKVNTNNIIFTAGSDQAIKNSFELFYKKNKEVITIDPTFAMVDIYCKIFRTKQIKIGYDNNLKLRLKDIYGAINKNTSLIILANPNSPTGTVIAKRDLIKIINKAKKYNAKVLLDEAYHEFSNYNFSSKIKDYTNLIIIRTFSKIFGLAGLRAGYVLSNKEIIKKYFAIKPMYEINSIAVKAIELMLSNSKYINFYLKEMREGEEYAKIFCKKNNFEFIKCNANFFYVYFNFDSKKIQNYLLKKNFLIKSGPSVDNFEKYLRISFAKKSTISLLLTEIKKFLELKKFKNLKVKT